MNMKKINDLPPEILRKCFRSLSPPDLKSSVLVSEDWRAVGEDPSLWNWCKVTIRNREDINKLSVRRLRKVQTIRIEPGGNWEAGDWEALLQAVASKELPQLEELDLGCRHLSTEQMTSILTRIAQEDIKLKKLKLKDTFINLSVFFVEAEVLAKVMMKLEEVDLNYTEIASIFKGIALSAEQINSIFTRIAHEDTKLKKLNMYGSDLFYVEPEVLVRGLTKLEEANLGMTNLRTEQITSILTRIAQEDTKLKKLNLQGNYLMYVEPEVLTRGLIKLEEVDLSCRSPAFSLEFEQITSIITRIAQEDIQLKKLNLDGNVLSEVEPQALVRAVVKLEELNLGFTELRTEQMTSIITRIAQEDIKLKKLNLYVNYLSDVEPEVLARGLTKLEEANLGFAELRTQQMTSILTTIAREDTKLKKLTLQGNDMFSIQPEVLAKGLIKLEEVSLGSTELRTEQMTSILTTIAREDTKLKKLDLQGNDLSDVEPEALVRAVVKLEEVLT